MERITETLHLKFDSVEQQQLFHAFIKSDLLERMGLLLSTVAAELENEGDRVYLGSINEADRIRVLAHEWRSIRYASTSNEP